MKSRLHSILKFILLLTAIFNLHSLKAQAPQKMSYQAVVRDLSNVLITSTPVGIEISILQGSSSGPAVYKEVHTIATNTNGLVSLEIGTGTIISGSFPAINWAVGPYFIKSRIDPTGGTSYTITGTSELISVPYALYSGGSAGAEVPGTAVGDMKYWNGTAWTLIPVGTPGQFLQLDALNIPSWSGGTFVTLTTDPIASQTTFTPYNPGGGNITGLGITSSGGSPITAAGLCWDTSPNPTTANSNSLNPVTLPLGPFASYLSGLLPNTTYYVRAVAINSAGTSYGNQVSFTTFSPTLATVTTTAVSGVTGGIANSGGNVTSDGGAYVSAKGVCWSTSSGATIADSKTINGGNVGSFTSIANGLVNNTTYYIRAYATNVAGTAYGNEYSFTTAASLSIGSYYQGGLIAYYLQPSDPGYSASIPHGIIISQNDIAAGVTWGCAGTLITGANTTTVGGGAQNTLDIVAGCSTIGIAAELCDSLVLNSYSDWFLPSSAEWMAMDLNLILVNGISNGQGYWTSSQFDANNGEITFNNYPSYTGYIGNISKNDVLSYGGVVRAIRMF